MITLLSTCLRCLLVLALGWNGIVLAQAAVAGPTQPVAGVVDVVAGDAPAPGGAALLAQHDRCHAPAASRPALDHPHPAAPAGPGDGCCNGGTCACTGAASAVPAAHFVSPPVPVAHERAVAVPGYHPSHLLPLPFRPPIA